jgi:hypothetical protein
MENHMILNRLHIAAIQSALITAGAQIEINGEIDQATRSAYYNWQLVHFNGVPNPHAFPADITVVPENLVSAEHLAEISEDDSGFEARLTAFNERKAEEASEAQAEAEQAAAASQEEKELADLQAEIDAEEAAKVAGAGAEKGAVDTKVDSGVQSGETDETGDAAKQDA